MKEKKEKKKGRKEGRDRQTDRHFFHNCQTLYTGSPSVKMWGGAGSAGAVKSTGHIDSE